jgi:hypothetical protein
VAASAVQSGQRTPPSSTRAERCNAFTCQTGKDNTATMQSGRVNGAHIVLYSFFDSTVQNSPFNFSNVKQFQK